MILICPCLIGQYIELQVIHLPAFLCTVCILIINAFVHGEEYTEVTVSILASKTVLKIEVADNGKGMSAETDRLLFDRYYRGTNTEQKPEGTGRANTFGQLPCSQAFTRSAVSRY